MNQTQAIRQGVKVESEHMRTYNLLNRYVQQHGRMPPPRVMFTNIATDHVKNETINYYPRLKKAGL